MRIAYVSEHRLPTEKAHGHQIAAVCNALLELGHEPTIIAPFRSNPITQSFWDYYDVPDAINLTILGSKDYLNGHLLPSMLAFTWQMKVYARYLKAHFNTTQYDAIYTRSYRVATLLQSLPIPIILELHSLPKRRLKQAVRGCKNSTLIVTLTKATAAQLTQLGIDSKKIIVEPDAVDLRNYGVTLKKEEAQEQLNLKNERIIVGYVGRLKTMGMDKGVSDLLKALQLLQPTKKFSGLIVGGPNADKEAYEAEAKRYNLTEEDVCFTGAIPHKNVPTVLAACDIVTMPWPDKPHYRHHMSPLKMFEYMAARRPILTGDLPTIREVLTEETAVFCTPDSPKSIAEQLQWMASHSQEVEQKVESAFKLVQRYTWVKRTERIFNQLTAF